MLLAVCYEISEHLVSDCCSQSSYSGEQRLGFLFVMGSHSPCHGSKFAVTEVVAGTYVGLVSESFPSVCGI